jgi:hypothetical protein
MQTGKQVVKELVYLFYDFPRMDKTRIRLLRLCSLIMLRFPERDLDLDMIIAPHNVQCNLIPGLERE